MTLEHTTLNRWFWPTVMLIVLAAPSLMWLSQLAMQSMFNDPERWVPEDFPERRTYEWFIEHFESNDAIIVSWPGCTISDSRLVLFARAVRQRMELDPKAKLLIERVMSGSDVIETLTAAPLSLSRRAAVRRIQGFLVGADGQSSCAIVVLSSAGIWRREEAINIVLDVALRDCELSSSSLFLAGPPVEGLEIDRAGRLTFDRYAIPSAVISLIVCFVFLRSWPCTLVVFTVGLVGQGSALALVYLSGFSMNAVLIVMPPLLFVLAVSAGVHLTNYYKDELRRPAASSPVLRALRKGWGPCVAAAATTAVGLGSLGLSSIAPVKMFGLITAPIVVVMTGMILLLIPGAMIRWPMGGQISESMTNASLGRVWRRWSTGLVGNFVLLSTLFFVISIGCAVGLTKLETSVRLAELFRQDSRIMRDYAWLEAKIGPLVPVEVVLHFDLDSKLRTLEKLLLVRHVEQVVAAMDALAGSMSAADLVPPIPSGRGIRQTMARTAFSRRLDRERSQLIDSNYLDVSDRESWRISARAMALQPLDYGLLLSDLEERVHEALATAPNAGEEATVTVTGVIPFVYRVQHALLRDLTVSFMAAFGLVALVMVFVLRSLPGGLLAMLPNAFPMVVLFGMMGWLEHPVDIGTMMTASVALGIAVDDTLHFLTWFRRGMGEGLSRVDAVCGTFEHCGPAMIQTSVICALGMSIYAFSSFVPAMRFSWMMVALLIAALIGDLIFLPVLLVGPLGRVFQTGSNTKRHSTDR